MRFLTLLTLIVLTGCATTDQMAQSFGAGVGSVLVNYEFIVNYDQATNSTTASFVAKDGTRRVMTAAQLKAQCLLCNDKAQAALKASYKRAIKEIEATQRREMAALKAQRKQCGTFAPVAEPLAEVVPIPSGPQAGDTVVPVVPSPIDGTAADGSFTIPGEKGLFRVERAEPHCEIINGRKVCH